MSELPEGWERVQISAIAQVGTGSTPLRSTANFYVTNGIPWVTSAATSQAFVANSVEYVTAAAVAAHRLKTYLPGTLLVAMYGEGKTRGQVSELCISATINQACAAIVVDGTKALRRYVKLALQTNYMVMRDLAEGGNQPNLNLSKIKEFEIPLPPLFEQTRIANQLDTLLARIQACNDRFDAIPALLKRFRQTVLDAATSGRLTEDWRGLDDLKQGEWETVALQDVITEMRNGLAQKPTESPLGSKILRIGAVRSGQLNLDDHRYLAVSDKEAEQYALKQDDLLFTRYNGSLEFVGVCAALMHDAPGYVYPDKLIRVRVRAGRAIAKFIEIAFGCRSMRTQVESFVKSSAGQRGVSGADLKTAKFSLPPIAEQTEIVRRVEALFTLADRIEARCTAARTLAQRLTPLVLAKGFRGELMPQEPNDEPASALLARIASSNTAVAGKNKRKVPVALKERA